LSADLMQQLLEVAQGTGIVDNVQRARRAYEA
jgi:hypothetical protein